MRFQKYLWYVRGLSVAICIELVALSLVTLPLKAQSIKVSLDFPPTEDVGAPDRTGGGGQRRGQHREVSCVSGDTVLTAVTPENNLVTTVSANPTLFWYIPQTRAESAEFTIQEDDNPKHEIYRTTFAVNGTPGIAKLSLPATVALETGKRYKWQLALVCNRDNPIENQLVEGLIERSELSLAQQSKLATEKEPLKQAKIYAQARVWQETLAILAQLRHEHPNDAKVVADWEELLKSVNLQEIATAPLIDCCTADPANTEQF